MKRIGAAILIPLCTLILLFAVLEGVVFRYVLVPTKPIPASIRGVTRYAPNQSGFYPLNREVGAKYRINADGWNARHESYRVEKPRNKYRIAIIGDSYVEALSVDYRKSMAEQLEDLLGPDKFEVYRFGMSGANMFEYYHVMKDEVMRFHPDLVVVLLIHNDFVEDMEIDPNKPFFSELKVRNGKVIGEVAPYTVVSPTFGLRAKLFRLNMTRYFFFDRRISMPFFLRKNYSNEVMQDHVDIRVMKARHEDIRAAAEYTLRRMKTLCDRKHARLLVMIDGYRELIYDGGSAPENYRTGVLSLNRMASEIAHELDIRFVDMHPVFESDYRKNKKKFNFDTDIHFNEYGHRIAAETIAANISGGKPLRIVSRAESH